MSSRCAGLTAGTAPAATWGHERPIWLADGRWAAVRAVHPRDLDEMDRFLSSLSPPSRRMRFQGVVNLLPCHALAQLTRVDDEGHATLVALASATSTIVGEARLVRDEVDPRHAEFAIAVADAWQGRGLGRQLLQRLLERGHAMGLAGLYGSVLDDNHPMLGMLQRMGARPRPHADLGTVWQLATADSAAPPLQPALHH